MLARSQNREISSKITPEDGEEWSSLVREQPHSITDGTRTAWIPVYSLSCVGARRAGCSFYIPGRENTGRAGAELNLVNTSGSGICSQMSQLRDAAGKANIMQTKATQLTLSFICSWFLQGTTPFIWDHNCIKEGKQNKGQGQEGKRGGKALGTGIWIVLIADSYTKTFHRTGHLLLG